MNWDAVAAISAAFGAIGVIATVGYLAVQIRQNTSSIQGATEQSLMTAEMALYGLLAEHASAEARLVPRDLLAFTPGCRVQLAADDVQEVHESLQPECPRGPGIG